MFTLVFSVRRQLLSLVSSEQQATVQSKRNIIIDQLVGFFAKFRYIEMKYKNKDDVSF
jgi:hypothetical protein